MTEEFRDILGSLKNAALTESERVSMRNELVAFMAEHPARTPLFMRLAESFYFGIASSRFAPATVFAASLVLVVGIGTSYAAEAALPGDPLYGVKIHVKEKIEGMLATTAHAKTQWNAKRLTRRLEEAEELVAKNRLTPLARAEIETQINAASADFDTVVMKLASKEEGEFDAVSAQSNVEASLVGHARVLAKLSAHVPEARPILQTVRAHAEVTGNARTSNERSVLAKKDRKVRVAAADSRVGADVELREVRALAATPEIAATSTHDLASSTEEVETAIYEGDAQLRSGKYGEAFGTYQAAFRAARAVKVNLDAQMRFKERFSSQPAPASATLMMDASTPEEGAARR
ncbi:hypothetical protein HY970_03995 [Candidatus Kaiserbacteria bacterium]|nr:hypothetical protein [Candidatus Kaiserbacteria bacterium]